MSKPTLLVLAAGMGSRYGGLKQIDPMGPNGETILDYSVFDAIRAGFGRVVFIIRHDFAEAFRAGIGARFEGQIEVDYAFQKLDDLPEGFSVPEGREKPWGTSHAIWAARKIVNEPFAVINADDFYGHDAYVRAAELLASLDESADPTPCCLVGYYLEKTLSDHGGVNRGVASTKDGLLCDVEEIIGIARKEDGRVNGEAMDGSVREVAPDALVSMNFWGFSTKFFAQLEEQFISFLKEHGHELKSECYIPTVVDALITNGETQCHVLPTASSWFGVTYPGDKPHVVESVQALIDGGDYPAKLQG